MNKLGILFLLVGLLSLPLSASDDFFRTYFDSEKLEKCYESSCSFCAQILQEVQGIVEQPQDIVDGISWQDQEEVNAKAKKKVKLTPITDEKELEFFQSCAQKAELTKTPRVYYREDQEQKLEAFSGCIVVPYEVRECLSDPSLDKYSRMLFVVFHEMTHMKNKDALRRKAYDACVSKEMVRLQNIVTFLHQDIVAYKSNGIEDEEKFRVLQRRYELAKNQILQHKLIACNVVFEDVQKLINQLGDMLDEQKINVGRNDIEKAFGYARGGLYWSFRYHIEQYADLGALQNLKCYKCIKEASFFQNYDVRLGYLPNNVLYRYSKKIEKRGDLCDRHKQLQKEES